VTIEYMRTHPSSATGPAASGFPIQLVGKFDAGPTRILF